MVMQEFGDAWDTIVEISQEKAAAWEYHPDDVRIGRKNEKWAGNIIRVHLLCGDSLAGMDGRSLDSRATCVIFLGATSTEQQPALKLAVRRMQLLLNHICAALEAWRITLSPEPILNEIEQDSFAMVSTEFSFSTLWASDAET